MAGENIFSALRFFTIRTRIFINGLSVKSPIHLGAVRIVFLSHHYRII